MVSGRSLCVGVLISGNGSNLQAIIDQIHAGRLNAQIGVVISNVPNAFGLERARRAGIPQQIVDHHSFPDRASFDRALIQALDNTAVELVVLAGFMRILSPEFVRHYEGRIINIHPSLLPKYPGLDTHRRAIEAGDREHGATVHFVNTELDAGPIIIQRRVPIKPTDTADLLQQRVHEVEHQILPLAIQWFAEQRLQINENQVYLDGAVQKEQGFG